jgi:two-component system, OmpR family, alkaline phosphatase synthesis response regulator PhoP
MPTNKGYILLVEDEANLHETIKLNLELEGYIVKSAFDGEKALQIINEAHYDLIVLDIMLPYLDGITVLETIRMRKIETAILLLSAKNTSNDKIIGLRKGADDYLTKPFNLEELLLRIQKLVEKNQKLQQTSTINDEYSFGGNTIYFNTLTAINFKQEDIALSNREAMLLKLLVEQESQPVTREKILQIVWGYQVYPSTRTIDNFILNFRKYFEVDSRNPKHFHSIRSVGYKFTAK